MPGVSGLPARRLPGVIELLEAPPLRRPVRPQWEPGFASLTWITVGLEPEPANQYEKAVADGWKAEQG
jgi:hypothetical protein